MAMQRIKDASEKAKIDLSGQKETEILLPYLSMTANGPLNVQKRLSRATFESLSKELLDRCKKPIEDAMSQSKLSYNDIDQVLLVGGSSRMPTDFTFFISLAHFHQSLCNGRSSISLQIHIIDKTNNFCFFLVDC